MKYLLTSLLFSVLALVGCTHSSPAPKVPLVSADDCARVYDHILTIMVDKLFGFEDDYTKKVGRQMLDKSLRNDGTADRFFATCSTSMTKEQVRCMIRAQDLEGLNVCRLIGITENK